MSEESFDAEADIDRPIVEKKSGFSMIWLLPLLAAAIGGWLVYKSIVEAGIVISIKFDSAEGIEEGKTKILYKGLIVGVVKTVKISEDLQDVTVLAEVKREAESGLRENTQFWLVRPKVSFTGITGLETLVSGNYIGVRPGDGKPRRHFKAVAKAPALDMSVPGLHIKLMADELGSIDRGSMVYYREIPVGEVQDYELSEDNAGIILSVHIEEEYASLVKTNSRFWNASGVTVKAGLTGVTVRTESLASVVAGGIGFNTPDSAVAAFSRDGDVFNLYKDYDSAEVGISARIRFKEAKGLEENTTKVKYEGFTVGVVKKLNFEEQSKSVVAEVSIEPRYEKLLRTDSLFWFAEPRLSLAEFSRLGDLLQGGYIGIRPGGGTPSRDFTALDKAPLLSHDTPGLHLTLDASELGAIEPGSPVLYKKVAVGKVEDYTLADNGRSVAIEIHVEESYAHLVRNNTRFWNAGGLQVAGRLTDFQIRTGTLTSILAGGVEFVTPPGKQRPLAKNGDRFILYDGHSAATENGRL
ncbi:MAG: MlaD family protein, partial [Pseudomonadota bacterium]